MDNINAFLMVCRDVGVCGLTRFGGRQRSRGKPSTLDGRHIFSTTFRDRTRAASVANNCFSTALSRSLHKREVVLSYDDIKTSLLKKDRESNL